MKMTLSDFLKIGLVSFLVAGLLFTAAISQTGGEDEFEYDPWYDLNDDGIIDISDVVLVTARYRTTGTPLSKAILTYDSGWVNITDKAGQYFNITHSLNSTDIIVDITGKTTLSGGVHQRHLGGTGYTKGWIRTYGGVNDDFAYSVVETSDGGYALAGFTSSFGAGAKDSWLVKVDSSGNHQWNKTYGGTSDDMAYSVVETSDGGYALASDTSSFGAGQSDGWLVKVDSSGNHQWNETYGGTSREGASSVVQTSDGGYAMVGLKLMGLHWDVWLVKTNSTGNMQWDQTYGETLQNDEALSVIQTSDGGYAIAGALKGDFWLVKTDANGNMQWNKTYGGINHEIAYSVVETSDGGYAMAGYTYSVDAEDYDFWLVKTEVESGLAWTDSTADTITLYRGATDAYWNYVRVRIWEIKETP